MYLDRKHSSFRHATIATSPGSCTYGDQAGAGASETGRQDYIKGVRSEVETGARQRGIVRALVIAPPSVIQLLV